MKYRMETRLGSTGDVRPYALTNSNIESNWGDQREGREAELTNAKDAREIRGKFGNTVEEVWGGVPCLEKTSETMVYLIGDLAQVNGSGCTHSSLGGGDLWEIRSISGRACP